MSDVLADFLLARIAEDEESAEREQVPVRNYGDGGWRTVPGRLKPGDRRLLAECEAKRQRIDAYRSAIVDERMWSRRPDSTAYHQAVARVSAWTFALATDARTYADHEDYQESWRPA